VDPHGVSRQDVLACASQGRRWGTLGTWQQEYVPRWPWTDPPPLPAPPSDLWLAQLPFCSLLRFAAGFLV
jgi:hypothetical protein